MSDTVLITLIQTVPGILWALFAVIVFVTLRRPLVRQFSRLRAANTLIGSFDFEVALDMVEDVVDGRPGRAGEGRAAGVPSRTERRAVATRLEYAVSLLDGGRILWVDDQPSGNGSLIRIFERAGMAVRAVQTTDAALAEVGRGRFDVIITDMARAGDPQAGSTLVDRLAAQGSQVPIILYTLNFDPRCGVHPDIFGYTTAYDELIHLVIDIMERVRFGALDERRASGMPRQAISR